MGREKCARGCIEGDLSPRRSERRRNGRREGRKGREGGRTSSSSPFSFLPSFFSASPPPPSSSSFKPPSAYKHSCPLALGKNLRLPRSLHPPLSLAPFLLPLSSPFVLSLSLYSPPKDEHTPLYPFLLPTSFLLVVVVEYNVGSGIDDGQDRRVVPLEDLEVHRVRLSRYWHGERAIVCVRDRGRGEG